MTDTPPINRFALWSLFATVVLLFPLGVVFAVVGLWQIWRSQKTQAGVLFACVSLLVSGLLIPGAAYMALYGKPKAFDRCYYTQENAVGVLRLILHLEEEFRATHGRYGKIDEIGFKPRVSTRPYRYDVEVAEADHFMAVAHGVEYMEGDLLVVDEKKRVERIQNRCVQAP